jgi:chromate transport protein ChrA
MEHENAKHVIDALSIGGILATLAGWLPAIAAILSIVWTLIRIYETRTVQRWLGK